MQGTLIAIEGNDAAGKATQALMLATKLTELGRTPVLYSFPRYDTPIGQTILRHLQGKTLVAEPHPYYGGHEDDPPPRRIARAPEDPLWFQCVCAIDKYAAVGEILDHIRAGRVVICDRWKPSAVSFGAADGLDVMLVDRIQDRLPDAHLNIFISVSETEALRRRPNLRDRYEKDRKKQSVVRDNYERLWAERGSNLTEPNLWVVIDGEGTVEEVHARIWEQVAYAEAVLAG